VVPEGAIGHHLYVIEDGEFEVIHDSRPVATLCPGDSFGEIALLRYIPRTATVLVKTPATLLSLKREGFLEEVTGHPVVRKVADVTARDRLRQDEDVDAGSGET
jgi:CRP-like cAMP-binding protein